MAATPRGGGFLLLDTCAGVWYNRGAAISTAYAASASLTLGFVTISGYAGGVGYLIEYKDGKLTHGGILLFGYSISVDVFWIIDLFSSDVS